MNEATNEATTTNDRTVADEVDGRQQLLTDVFGLAPETARVTAEDHVASRMRNPGPDAVDTARVAAAKEQNAALGDDASNGDTE